ncbi:MAG: septum formation initiator family protein [Oscillospiraceae bacterium]|nr:septum formation initiator family protein [Oscillospiraceae bacterium]MBQ5313950.1 septum formation initiator family protein [Oscillospiraceae bacterium]
MKKFFNIKIIAVICAVAYLSVSLISAQFDLMTKKQQLAILETQQQKIQLETQDIERMLEFEDEEDYIERIARQRLGYANPNEKIFKDIQGE